MIRRVACLGALWCALAAGVASAQTGGLVVSVADAQGRPLPGAVVVLTSDEALVARTSATADPRGTVSFPVLRAGGGYAVEASMDGFATRRVPGIRVVSDETVRVDVRLADEVNESVEIVARTPVVDLENTRTSTTLSDEFVDDLPVPGRFYQNVLTLAPGVKDSDGDGNPNVHGARQRNFQAQVGGVSNVDPLTGEWLSYVNAESIEELEIITTGAGAEFGRASGGFARIIQKQGSNTFEGTVAAIYSSSRFDGDGAGSGGPAVQVPDFTWFQPMAQVSGPIVRDRLWFRLSHEVIERDEPIALPGGIETIRRSQVMNSDQITWQVSPRNKLAFQWSSDPVEIENFDLEARLDPSGAARLERGGDTWSLTWTAPVSARLLVDSQVAWQDHGRDETPMTVGVPYLCPVRFTFVYTSLNETQCTDLRTGQRSGSSGQSSSDRRQRLTARSQATWYAGRLFGMSHRFKIGMQVENERYFREIRRSPEINFFTETDLFTGETTGFVNARISAPESSRGRALGSTWALWAEDQIRLRSNLVLTAGLRFDREEIRSEGESGFDPEAEFAVYQDLTSQGLFPSLVAPTTFTGFPAIAEFLQEVAAALDVDPDLIPVGPTAIGSAFWLNSRRPEDIDLALNNLSPRVSLAWDPFGDGKTKLAATWGRYYDKLVLAVPLLELEPPETELNFLAFQQGNVFRAVNTLGGASAAVDVQLVDRDLRTPYQDELSLSAERELWQETSARVTYIRRKYRDQLQDVDINHGIGDYGRCIVTSAINEAPVLPNDGEGDLLEDPYTGLLYVDTDPGPGDGILDDCTGAVRRVGGVSGVDDSQPDGLPDLYQRNPGWGEVLLVGNFNTTDYKAFVVEVVRRLYRNWQLDFNYTWSEAVGNAEDFTQVLGNESTLFEDEFGYLDYDQRHVAQLNAVTVTPWGLRLGGKLRWESGLPYSEVVSALTLFSLPPSFGNLGDRDVDLRFRYPSRQRNDQRNPSFWTVDVRAAKDFRVGRTRALQVSAEIFNLLNDGTVTLDDRLNGDNAGTSRFGRRFQFGFKLTF